MGDGPGSDTWIAGKYRLGDCIGAGGMGAVYRAEQPALARTVAIKFLHRELAGDPAVAERFRIEAIDTARLRHPNTVAVLDYGEHDDGTPFLVMEFVDGWTLGQLIRVEGPPSLRRTAHLVGQILAALGSAHRAGIVHADVKSDNVLVEARPDEGERVKLVDFGLARVGRPAEPGASPAGLISGTPDYMAPEVIAGAPPTPAADLYAVGVILYELLTGATPFGGGTPADVLVRHLEDPVVPPSLRCPDRPIPAELEDVVVRALAKSPHERFPDAAALAAAIAVSVAEVGAWETPATPVPDVATRNDRTAPWRSPASGVASARGVRARAPAEPEGRRLRRAIGEAIVRGLPYEVAAGYLALADCLADGGHPEAAVRELEEGVDVLSGGHTAEAPDGGPVRRLLRALVPLYEALGEPARAIRAAAAAGERALAHPAVHAGTCGVRRT